MSKKLKKCSDAEITNLLNSVQEKKAMIKLQRLTDDQVENYINRYNEDTTDSDEIYDKPRTKTNISNKEDVALKIKLRRSTEHSHYKITNDSDCMPNSCKKKELLRNRKEDGDITMQNKNEIPCKVKRICTVPAVPVNFNDYNCENLSRLSTNKTVTCNMNYSSRNIRKSINDVEVLFNTTPKSNRHSNVSNKIDEVNNRYSKNTKSKSMRLSNVVEPKQDKNTETQEITDTPRRKILFKSASQDKYDESKVNSSKSSLINKENKKNNKNNLSHSDEEESEDEELNRVCKSIKKVFINKNISTPQRQSKQDCTDVEIEKELHLHTPKSRLIKQDALTPSMVKRSTVLVKPVTPFQQVRSKLHVSAIPKSLPCREEEFNNIYTFLERKLIDKCGGCIYISGVPGTGKTATVNEVIRCLKKETTKGKLSNFDFIEINGMKLTEPRQAYVQILKQLTGKTCKWEQAHKALETQFNSLKSKKSMILLLVDELDLLCTKRQDVVYNLLEWPTKASAQLVVITIANTMDLPERILMGRVTSRLGLTRLTFQPYSHKQLQEIILSRLKVSNAFRSEAVQLVARKVAAVSGDARRALDICRRATEIAELREGETVSMQDVNQALSEMIANAKIQAIKHCSQMEQFFLQAVSAEVIRTGLEEACFKNIYKQFETFCLLEGTKTPTITETLAICGRLFASRLLISEQSKTDIYQRILLNISADDVHFALKRIDLS